MKKFLLLTAVIGLFGFGSCKKGVEAFLEVSGTTPASIAREGGKATFSIASDAAWTISTNVTWLTFDPPSGQNNATVTATATENTGAQRSTDVTVTAGSTVRTIKITQTGLTVPFISVSNLEPAQIPVYGGAATFEITTNVNWSIEEPTVDWLTVDPKIGEGNTTVTINIDQNDGDKRSVNLKISAGEPGKEMVRNVTVTQRGVARPVTIDDLVGKYLATEGMLEMQDEGPKEFPIVTEDVLTITKVNETTIKVDGIFAAYFPHIEYPGFSIEATYNPEEQLLTMPFQQIEPDWLLIDGYDMYFFGDYGGAEEPGPQNPVFGNATNEGDGVSVAVWSREPEEEGTIIPAFYVGGFETASGEFAQWNWAVWSVVWNMVMPTEVPALAPVKEDVVMSIIYAPAYKFGNGIKTAMYQVNK